MGPLTFTVHVNQRHDDRWELQATSELAAVTMASHQWETDALACTPNGIVAEIADRDVLSQLTEATRSRVAEATRLLHEFDTAEQPS